MLATNDKIRQFIFDQFPIYKQKMLKDDSSLIESGIIDSMGMLELVMFVESNFHVEVQDVDLTPENFESIQALSTFIESKKDN